MTPEQRTDRDRQVIERVRMKGADGASAEMIARVYLGPRAGKHGKHQLQQVGLAVAARLCGAGLIAPTRSNRFVVPA